LKEFTDRSSIPCVHGRAAANVQCPRDYTNKRAWSFPPNAGAVHIPFPPKRPKSICCVAFMVRLTARGANLTDNVDSSCDSSEPRGW
jgi:hypothetical protein